MRALNALGRRIGLAVVFTVAAAGSAILHLGLAVPRRLVVACVNPILERSFRGKITVQRLGAIGLTRIAGVSGRRVPASMVHGELTEREVRGSRRPRSGGGARGRAALPGPWRRRAW